MLGTWNRSSIIAPLCLVAACGGAPESAEEDVEGTSSALSASDHFYLRCNVTSWDLNSTSYMVPTGGDGRLRVVEFTVDEQWELTGNTCQPMSTDVLGQWGSSSAVYQSVYGAVTAPGATLLTPGQQQFAVKFPRLGRYRATLNAANGSFSVEPATEQRRALAVITNFQDRTIADRTDAGGVKTAADLDPILDSMENHWAWLSRGREEMPWDIIQVTLPRDFDGIEPSIVESTECWDRTCPASEPGCAAGPCQAGDTCHRLDERDGNGNVVRWWTQCEPWSWWGDYRQQVVDAALAELDRTGVDPAVYDFDHDGDIDALWSVVADDRLRTATILGGASAHSGARVFVDGQASDSILGNHYGNFNHEVCHLRDVPDLYGPFSNAENLTLMAYSWSLPGHDLDAYARARIGWAVPREIRQSTVGARLSSAQQAFDAVKIPTSSASEYFLIEYRVTPPAPEYGSEAPSGLDGLIVYHVMDDGRWQDVNPPMWRIEPADGVVAGGKNADLTDALTPANVSAQQPFVARSYSGSEVFRITRVAQDGTGMLFDITVTP